MDKISLDQNIGVFCISLDTELIWGRHDLNYQPFLKYIEGERKIIKILLEMFDKNSIPATWAIVGHLFLEQCQTNRGLKHKEIVRPKFSWVKGDWFKNDPATSFKKNPDWYGPDIIRLIKKYRNQDIGSHSFSHLIFGDKGCSRKCAESDIRKCVEQALNFNLNFTSFVFPRNKIGHLDVLKKYNFKVYRGAQKKLLSLPNFLAKTLELLDYFLMIPHTTKVTKENGLINVPSTMYYISARGFRKFIPVKIRVLKAKMGILKAIRKKQVFHLWFHPYDLKDADGSLIKGFKEIIDFVSKKQQEGKIEIKNLKQFIKS